MTSPLRTTVAWTVRVAPQSVVTAWRGPAGGSVDKPRFIPPAHVLSRRPLSGPSAPRASVTRVVTPE